ncbi:protein DOG1-like 1 [Impatiens glandulifera]|uniref:protein DOG1-like 1 n=1 Tax=Impatiens glandulifera TaxID=253017 RepID=UPI001FB18CBD|nr:protein DOG1-like 1 [Impatiens glandulifera]
MASTSNGTREDDDEGDEDKVEFKSCFTNWMTQQEDDLEELNRVMEFDSDDEVKLRAVVERVLGHFQNYLDKRSQTVRHNVSGLNIPSWCPTFEKSVLWMGGCRATICIRLVYALCGFEAEATIMEYLQGVRRENIGELTVNQFNLINTLQMNTTMEENRLCAEMISFQDSMVDEPLMSIAKCAKVVGERSEAIERAIERKTMEMGNLMKEANKLRLNTLKELLTNILTPLQSVKFLIVSKKLHLSLHQWSDNRDEVFNPTHNE